MSNNSPLSQPKFNFPVWISILVGIYFAYNFVFGVWTTISPDSYLAFAGKSVEGGLLGWRVFGVICILWGIAGGLLLKNPPKFRWVSWAGVLSSIIAVPGLLIALRNSEITGGAFLFSFPFDLLGLGILPLAAYRIYQFREVERVKKQVFEEAVELPEMAEYETNRGINLAVLSKEKPVLLVFLRHFGCTFCREALAEVSKNRTSIEDRGAEIVLVHMVEHGVGDEHLEMYGLVDTHQISDPTKKLYNAFELKRGKFSQLFGLRTWLEGFRAGVIQGHGVGKEMGDSNQMPGLFVISDGKVVQGFRHKYASDRPDLGDITTCLVDC